MKKFVVKLVGIVGECLWAFCVGFFEVFTAKMILYRIRDRDKL